MAAAAATTDYERVRAALGENAVMEADDLVRTLLAAAPVELSEVMVRQLVDCAKTGSGNRVRVEDFLRLFAERCDRDAKVEAATEVFFCRHGETDWNLSHKLQGLTDVPLNASGHEQADCIAQALRSKGLAAVWTSPLARARDTAAAIAEAAGIQLRVDERLRERNLGVMEGRTSKEVEAAYPAVWAAWQAFQELPEEGNAEPEAEVLARVEAALYDLATAHPGQTVALVAHGGVLRVLCRRAFGNASISTLLVGPGRSWHAKYLDDGSHLKTPGLKV